MWRRNRIVPTDAQEDFGGALQQESESLSDPSLPQAEAFDEDRPQPPEFLLTDITGEPSAQSPDVELRAIASSTQDPTVVSPGQQARPLADEEPAAPLDPETQALEAYLLRLKALITEMHLAVEEAQILAQEHRQSRRVLYELVQETTEPPPPSLGESGAAPNPVPLPGAIRQSFPASFFAESLAGQHSPREPQRMLRLSASLISSSSSSEPEDISFDFMDVPRLPPVSAVLPTDEDYDSDDDGLHSHCVEVIDEDDIVPRTQDVLCALELLTEATRGPQSL